MKMMQAAELGFVHQLTCTSRLKAPVTLSDKFLLPLAKDEKEPPEPEERCLLRGYQAWTFDIPRIGDHGEAAERVAWNWLRSRIEEAILLSHTGHAYAEFIEYKWRPDNYQRCPPLVVTSDMGKSKCHRLCTC